MSKAKEKIVKKITNLKFGIKVNTDDNTLNRNRVNQLISEIISIESAIDILKSAGVGEDSEANIVLNEHILEYKKKISQYEESIKYNSEVIKKNETELIFMANEVCPHDQEDLTFYFFDEHKRENYYRCNVCGKTV